MGETIAKLMVAIFCVMFAGSNAGAQSSTQEPTTTLRLFKPQIGTNGGSQGSGTRTGMGIPDFTGDAGRATARTGGPSTEQSPRANSTRENVWAPNRPSNMQLPSTDPVLPGAIRTVSGTQDPNSAESQLLARQRDAELAKQRQARERLEQERLAQERAKMAAPVAPTGAGSTTGTGSTAGQGTGFVNAPKDIALPQQNLGTGDATGLAGMFESVGQALASGNDTTAGGSATSTPNWPTMPTTGGQPTGQRTAQPGAGLTLPTEMTPRLNSNWTKEHVEELISMFNIPRDDPKLANPEYINYLHELFVKDRQERARRAAQQAATANSRAGFGIPTGTASAAVGNTAPTATDRALQMQGYDARTASTRTGMGAFGTGTQNLAGQQDLAGQAMQRDRFGDPITSNAGLTNQVPQETIEQKLARMLDERDRRAAAANRVNPYQANQYPPNQYPPNYGQYPYGYPNGVPPQAAGGFVPQGFTAQGQTQLAGGAAQAGAAMVNNPAANTTSQGITAQGNAAQDVSPGSPSDLNDRAPEHASIATAPDVRNFSPLVNVLLLCSICFNLFLWKHMQSLRYNYRDVTVANRLSANGFGD